MQNYRVRLRITATAPAEVHALVNMNHAVAAARQSFPPIGRWIERHKRRDAKPAACFSVNLMRPLDKLAAPIWRVDVYKPHRKTSPVSRKPVAALVLIDRNSRTSLRPWVAARVKVDR